MRTHSAPSFEQLEKLKDTRDADLINRALVDPARNRGRGAQSNKESRFDTESRVSFDEEGERRGGSERRQRERGETDGGEGAELGGLHVHTLYNVCNVRQGFE